jgi:phenylacetate-coenzyme A ligase PaaK-like adenylate-forming protein
MQASACVSPAEPTKSASLDTHFPLRHNRNATGKTSSPDHKEVDSITEASLRESISASRKTLDAWVREMVSWHFDPATGCPFWLEYAEKLDWNPRKEIHGFDDLSRFGFFQDEWLRGGPVRRWVPRAYQDRPVFVFETGGSTGAPKSRINIEDFRLDYEAFSHSLPDEFFPPGSDWLMLGPSGPRRLRLAVEHLAQHRGGICFSVDLDPRWVIKLTRRNELEEVERYKQHVIEQALTLLRAHPNIHCLFATPKLLEALCEKISLKKVGITGVFCGGTEMTPQFHRFAVEELLEGAYFAPTYGNTLMGLAVHKPFDPRDHYAVIYYPPLPRAVIEVVAPESAGRIVDYGESGRVLLTTLTREFFMPRFLERDEAEREPPCELYPWDGVRNVRPFQRFQDTVVEGVY